MIKLFCDNFYLRKRLRNALVIPKVSPARNLEKSPLIAPLVVIANRHISKERKHI